MTQFRFHATKNAGPHTIISVHSGAYPGAYCGTLTFRNEECESFEQILLGQAGGFIQETGAIAVEEAEDI